MANQSNRLLIARGLVYLLANTLNGASNLYGYTKLGAVFDPSPYTSWAEVTDPRGKVGHAGSGGNVIGWRVEDTIAYKVTSGWPYDQDSTAAMTNMLTAQDILLPMFASHYLIPNPDNPSVAIGSVFSVLEDQGTTDTALPVRFPNGKVYLLWTLYVQVMQQYNILQTVP